MRLSRTPRSRLSIGKRATTGKRAGCKGDREGRPYKDYDASLPFDRIFVGATLAVALEKTVQ